MTTLSDSYKTARGKTVIVPAMSIVDYYGFGCRVDLRKVQAPGSEVERTLLKIFADPAVIFETLLIVVKVDENLNDALKFGNASVTLRYRGWSKYVGYLRENFDNGIVAVRTLHYLSRKFPGKIRVVTV